MRALYAGAKYYVLHRGNTQKDFEVESKVYLHLVAYTFLLLCCFGRRSLRLSMHDVIFVETFPLLSEIHAFRPNGSKFEKEAAE